MRTFCWGLVASLLSLTAGNSAVGDDWPQWRGPERDGVWREQGLIERFPSEQIPLRWSVPLGSGYCGPTVADGRVYVMDRLVEPQQVERVHCLNAADGRRIWMHQYRCQYVGIGYQAGPRASVTIDQGRAYALGTMGHLHCYDAETGKILWQRDLNADYQIQSQERTSNRMPIWGIAAAPLIYHQLVILHIGGRDGACVVGLDKRTGQERWRALGDRASYSAPILVRQAGRDVVVCWTGDSVAGIHPAAGKVLWRFPFPPSRMPIGVATPVTDGDRLFVSSFYDGSLMLRLRQDRPAVEKIWSRAGRNERNTEALHSIISTPMILGDYVYGVDSYGELRCLEAATGRRVWGDLTATPKARWSTIHMVRNGDRIWMFNERGQLIIARLSPDGFHEISRAQLIEPTEDQLPRRGGVCWSHPAYADRCVFARNDQRIVCASLAAD